MICIYILVLGGPCDRSEGVEILHRHGMVTEISTRQTNVFLILMKKLFFFFELICNFIQRQNDEKTPPNLRDVQMHMSVDESL